MEASAARWFSESGMGFPSLIHPWEASSIDQFSTEDIWESFHHSISSESYNSCPSFDPNTFSGSSIRDMSCVGRPMKIPKTEKNSSRAPDASSPSILSFGNPDSPSNHSDLYTNFVGGAVNPKEVDFSTPRGTKRSYVATEGQGPKGAGMSSHNQDHIIAERKRREKLSQRFIALSAIIPGLKKMDKASVLGDAIKHLQQLQEKVKTLEEQAAKRKVESAVLVKKSQLSFDDDGSSCDENFDGHLSDEPLPEIEVKRSEKMILVKIHCENRKGVIVKALSVIENLHLTISSTSAIPFTSSTLDITITAQIDEEFSMTVKDLLKKLNSAFRQFM